MYFIVFLLGLLSGYYLAPNNIVVSEENDIAIVDEFTSPDNEDEIQRLLGRLAESDSMIKYLQGMNDSLSSLLAGKKEELAVLLARPDIQKKINSMSDREISEKLLMMLRAEDLENIQNKKEMAMRLAEVALSGKEADTSMVTGAVAVSIFPEHVAHANELLNIKRYDRLYAHLSLSDQLEKTLVKWTNLSTGRTMLFKRMAFAPGELRKHVSMRPKTGWVVGDYQVSFYKIDQGFTLLANANYTLQTVEDSEPPEIRKGPRVIPGGDKVAVEPENTGFGLF